MSNGLPEELLGKIAVAVWPVAPAEQNGEGRPPTLFCHYAHDGVVDRCRFDTEPVSFVVSPGVDMGDEWLPEGWVATCARHLTYAVEDLDAAVLRYVAGLAERGNPWDMEG